MIILALAFALWLAVFLFVLFHSPAQTQPLNTKYIDFDFAGYCFGLVAVAVSCAGVYISLVVRPISADLIKRVETHLMPKPFSSATVAEDICSPAAEITNVLRGPEIKIIYAVVRLAKWATLEDNEKLQLLGPEGLNAGRLGFGRGFAKYEEQWDRRLVIVVAVVMCVIYATIPFIYLSSFLSVLISILWTLYFFSLVEAVVCACFFWRRSRYLNEFEKHLGGWRINIDHYILLTEAERVRLAKNPLG